MIKRIFLSLALILVFGSSVCAVPYFCDAKMDKNFAKVGHTLALVYVAHGNIYRALEQYSDILEYAPEDVYANYYMALLYEGLNNDRLA